MTTLFISDLHIDPAQPEIDAQFRAFLETEARAAETLYILGDLFESWLGDDDVDEARAATLAAIRAVADSGTRCFFMHGNRDFLIRDGFARASGCTLLDETVLVDLYGRRVLLMHGDLLCTDDVDYQAFRRMVRDPAWQENFLGLPLEQRRAIAAQVKEQTRAAVQAKEAEIMDVNPDTVVQTLRRYDVDCVIHGHTHRPAIHSLTVDGAQATRVVLGDWYAQGSVLRWDADGFSLDSLPRLSEAGDEKDE